jgi:hypothetical protein
VIVRQNEFGVKCLGLQFTPELGIMGQAIVFDLYPQCVDPGLMMDGNVSRIFSDIPKDQHFVDLAASRAEHAPHPIEAARVNERDHHDQPLIGALSNPHEG